MFIGQPVVLAVLILKVGVALLTLLRSEVLKMLRTLLCIAKLKLKIDTSTIFTSINGPVERKHSRDSKTLWTLALGISLLSQVKFHTLF